MSIISWLRVIYVLLLVHVQLIRKLIRILCKESSLRFTDLFCYESGLLYDAVAIVIVYVILFIIVAIIRQFTRIQLKVLDRSSKVVAFFHPSCADCGGRERVLWSAIHILHQLYPLHTFVIYSDNYAESLEDILTKVQQSFQLETAPLRTRVHLVKLRTCFLLQSKLYPFFTGRFQIFGSRYVAIEALFRCPPDIMIDTMEVPACFSYPIFRALTFCSIATYVHFPTICADMVNFAVNRQFVARTAFLNPIKPFFYDYNAGTYWAYSRHANIIMCNSTWTRNLIHELWYARKAIVLCPPCNIENLKRLPLTDRDPNLIISIAAFHPQKNHQLQLQALARLAKLLEGENLTMPRMAIIGFARRADDFRRVKELKELSKHLRLKDCIDFHVNPEYAQMEALMDQASIAMHTMKNEPFAIGVAEFLAAGLLTVAHNSGGQPLDIIKEGKTGFLADDAEKFSQVLFRLLKMPESEATTIREAARKSVECFSTYAFERQFAQLVGPLL